MNKTKATILIIDDDEDVLLSAKLLLKKQYEKVITRNSPKEINQLISTQEIDVIVLDMNYRIGFNDGKEGIYWLKHILSIKPKMVIILMTAYGEVELAVDCIKNGAFDFILKPWTNEKFIATIHAGLELSKSNHKISILEQTNKSLQKSSEQKFGTLIGKSSSMISVMKTIDKVSSTEASILILGENGTGKQHLAREIHKRSEFSNGPFVHVDLGALSESLFESELFGHKKGAFTDAYEDKPGRFEMAENGTLFLDEIGNLPYNLQSKLLTVLQDRKVTRLGESIERQFNARLLFATNAPLNQWVIDGKFRQDLLFRINTVEITIPPLRKRKEDIKEFVMHYLHLFRDKYHKSHLQISREAFGVLNEHNWPGNVREMQHTIERGVIMADHHEISPDDFNLSKLPTSSLTNSTETNDTLNLQEVEKMLIEKAIKKHEGNISKAAKDLGLTRAALYRRLEKFNL
jgi:DNA-binding NtrC family response regulator